MIKSLFSKSAWILALSRGGNYFFAGGCLYSKSDRVTQEIRETFGKPIADLGGKAFRRVSLASLFMSKRKQQVDAVLIAGVGRLGNSVVQIINVVNLARFVGANKVFYHLFTAIDNRNLRIADDISLEKISVFGRRSHPPEIIWRTYAVSGPEPLYSPFDASTTPARAALSKAVFDHITPVETSPTTLTIHLRSGDIFGPNPHPSYGQPPWAYYLRVLTSQPWSEVRLVAEDSNNPCHAGVLSWCQEMGITAIKAGQSIESSLAEISSAHNLVTGIGTFCPAIVYLSMRPIRVYVFGAEIPALLRDSRTEVYGSVDSSGSYTREILSGNWSNSTEQRELMMAYPSTALQGPERAS